MKKRIEDYAHLYLGCMIILKKSGRKAKLYGVEQTEHGFWINDGEEWRDFEYFKFTLILRPLSDISTDEVIALCKIEGLVNAEVVSRDATCIWLKDDSYNLLISFTGNITLYKGGLPYPMAKGFEINRYLLENKFDLFGLIEDKLAINKLSLKTT